MKTREQQITSFLHSKNPGMRGKFPEFKVCCPFCDDERYRFGFNIIRKIGHCFNCGESVGGQKLVQALGIDESQIREPTSFQSLDKILSNSSQIDEIVEVPELAQPGPLLTQIRDDDPRYAQVRNIAFDHLIARGYIDYLEISERNKLMIGATGTRIEGRLILPVFEKNKLVYWQARALYPHQRPKYLNPDKIEQPAGKSNFIFNLDAARHCREVVVCEGIFSALSVGENAVAVFGKELSTRQAHKLSTAGIKKIILLFDAGEMSAALKAARRLVGRVSVKIASLPYGDPNEVTAQELSTALLNAKPCQESDLIFD